MDPLLQIKKVNAVDRDCMETYPCQHTVHYVNLQDKACRITLDGPEILKLINDGRYHGVTVEEKEHFAVYAE